MTSLHNTLMHKCINEIGNHWVSPYLIKPGLICKLTPQKQMGMKYHSRLTYFHWRNHSWKCLQMVNHFVETSIYQHIWAETNCRHFADDNFKCIFFNENIWISLKISLKFVPKVQINNIPLSKQGWLVHVSSLNKSNPTNQGWLVYWRIYMHHSASMC